MWGNTLIALKKFKPSQQAAHKPSWVWSWEEHGGGGERSSEVQAWVTAQERGSGTCPGWKGVCWLLARLVSEKA